LKNVHYKNTIYDAVVYCIPGQLSLGFLFLLICTNLMFTAIAVTVWRRRTTQSCVCRLRLEELGTNETRYIFSDLYLFIYYKHV